jgi:hypothetical protein
LLALLNKLEFYHVSGAKSLGTEWLNAEFLPLLEDFSVASSVMSTVVEHEAFQIAKVLTEAKIKSVYITGGGAKNHFLIERIAYQYAGEIIIPKEEIQALPVEGRDITRTLIRLPNLTVATLGYAEAPNVSINGLGGTFTNYLIDGMDNNERFLGNAKFNTPVGFAEGISVLTNNYSVEFGNTSNGLVNVTSRTGSNKLTGEAFYLTRPGAVIDSKSPFATLDLSGNQVKDGFKRDQAGFGLGGALKKDKTFFYLNFEQTIDKKDNLLNVPQLGVNETVTGYNRFSYFSGKIDQVWSQRFKSSLRLNYGSFDIFNYRILFDIEIKLEIVPIFIEQSRYIVS